MCTWGLHGDFSKIKLLPAKFKCILCLQYLKSCANNTKNEAVPSFSAEVNQLITNKKPFTAP